MSVMSSSRAALHSLFIAWFVVSTVLLQPTDGYGYGYGFPWKWRKQPRPCWNKVFYFHDILYNGKNAKNATSAIVAAPEGANRTVLTGNNHFGDLVVFDDPITLDNNLQSHPVGRAQGFYFYDMKNTLSSWLGFTFVLNSTDHRGTITFTGADPILTQYRDISVVGGTGDFILARGIATISTDAFQGDVYFRLRVNITLYECYHCLYSISADDSASQNGKSKSVLA